MVKINYFVPGKRKETEGPLARYLQPMPAGVATAYIKAWTEPEQIVLNAFCQGKTVLSEAVQNGRKAIAVSFNPLAILAVRGHLTLRAEPQGEALNLSSERSRAFWCWPWQQSPFWAYSRSPLVC